MESNHISYLVRQNGLTYFSGFDGLGITKYPTRRWCKWRDSNPQSFKRCILSTMCITNSTTLAYRRCIAPPFKWWFPRVTIPALDTYEVCALVSELWNLEY